jgi:hypothetical protein
MIAEPAHLAEASRRSERLAGAVDAAGRRLPDLLDGTAGAFGWRGPASSTARRAADHAAAQLAVAARWTEADARSLAVLAGAVTQGGRRIRAARARRAALLAPPGGALVDRAGAGGGIRLPPLPTPASSTSSVLPSGPPSIAGPTPGHAAELARIDAGLRAEVAALHGADRRCAVELTTARQSLVALAAPAARPGWIATSASPPVAAVLAAHGLLGPAARAPVPRRPRRRPAPSIRAADRRRTAVRARAPAARTTTASRLRLLLRQTAGQPQAVAARRVAAFFAALSPVAARRLAVARPEVIGPLDGAPVADRVAANRVLIARSLAAELARRRRSAGGPVAARAAADRRVRLYRALLTERLDVGTGARTRARGPAPSSSVPHQVVLFDPAHGRLAEIWTPPDAGFDDRRPGHPGVELRVADPRVPFDDFTEFSARARTGRREAIVAWLGSDPPRSAEGVAAVLGARL